MSLTPLSGQGLRSITVAASAGIAGMSSSFSFPLAINPTGWNAAFP
jgi:hypothetical protein